MTSIRFLALGALCLCIPAAAAAQDISFGDDSGEYARDGECDDARFRGVGMSKSLDDDNIRRDATDCRNAFRDGRLFLWVEAEARAATDCKAIRFGDNSSEWARDGQCDDFRFRGPGADSIMLSEDIGKDAADCRAACAAGTVFLRDY
jgi:hypothetical protein